MVKAISISGTRLRASWALRPIVPLLVCAALALLVLQPVRSEAAEALPRANEFTLLTYNVHGLSPITSGGWWGVTRLKRIKRAFSPYQVVLLQEDFETREHLARGKRWQVEYGPGRVWRWGHLFSAPFWVPCWLTTLCGNPPIVGSGLTTQVKTDHFRAVEPLVSRAYEDCRGYVDHGADCFATKGFVGVRLRLDGGMVVDVYNTHLDAGNSEADLAVRWEQIRALSRVVESHSPDAVILAGDFNANLSGGDRGDDFAPVQGLLDGLHLQDASARPRLGSDWKTMDYILFRSGPATHLELAPSPPLHSGAGPAACGPRGRARGEDDCFLSPRGRALSDHPALFAHFRASPQRARVAEREAPLRQVQRAR